MEKVEEREPVILYNQGQKIFGVLHRPINTKDNKIPVVLMCHGLGGNKVGKGRLYVTLAEKLATLGIGTLRIDFRGSGDSEGNFSAMTIESEVSDALTALDYLQNLPFVDNTRIAVFGRSLGGLVAVMAAKRFGSIKSIALWAPVFGCDQWKEQWAKAHATPMATEQRNSLLDMEGMRPGYPFFEQLFTLKLNESLLDLTNVPFFHIHGEKDTMVDISHAQKFKESRQAASGESRFKLLPLSDHDFSDRKERQFAIDETAEWFTNTLMS